MICAKLIPVGSKRGVPLVAPCGQCMPCRINRRRFKTARFILEALSHEVTTFVTRTIAPEHLEHVASPDGVPLPTVRARDNQLFNKRTRHHLPAFRFVSVGEYGNLTGRPHYHDLWFGVPPATALEVLRETWDKGNVQVSEASIARMAYTAGYTAKKLTKADDDRLQGAEPEFMRQSLRPAIGYPALDWLEELHYTKSGSQLLQETKDVATCFRTSGRIWPLDRTIRARLRERLGVDKPLFTRPRGIPLPDADAIQKAVDVDARMLRRAHRSGEVL